MAWDDKKPVDMLRCWEYWETLERIFSLGTIAFNAQCLPHSETSWKIYNIL